MLDASILQAIQESLNRAEHQLGRIAPDLQFLITPEGVLQIVRRDRDGLPAKPARALAELKGCDPLLWQAERPEGDVTLGMPYLDVEPRCALSRRHLERGAAVDLYHRGRPLSPDRAAELAPRLALVRGLVVALGGLLAELETLVPRAGDTPTEAGDAFRRWEIVWREMAQRVRNLRQGSGGLPGAGSSIADEN